MVLTARDFASITHHRIRRKKIRLIEAERNAKGDLKGMRDDTLLCGHMWGGECVPFSAWSISRISSALLSWNKAWGGGGNVSTHSSATRHTLCLTLDETLSLFYTRRQWSRDHANAELPPTPRLITSYFIIYECHSNVMTCHVLFHVYFSSHNIRTCRQPG